MANVSLRKDATKPRMLALETMARLLEDQMDVMGLSEKQKHAKIDGLVFRVAKLKAARRG